MLRNFFLSLGSAVLIGQAAIALAADPPKLDNYGDPLPAGAVLRLGTTRLGGHGGFVWMPDGQSLVTARGGELHFWNIADGKPGPTLQVPMTGVFRHYLARTADGTRIVCADQYGKPCVWDLKNSRLFSDPAIDTGDRQYINSLAMSPDGSTFVTLGSGKLRWFDSATCQLQRTDELQDRNLNNSAALFSPDGKRLALALSRSIQLLDPAHEKEFLVLRDPHEGGGVYSLAFSSDSKRLLSAGDGRPELRRLPDGKIVEISRARIRVWDVGSLRPLADLPLDEILLSACTVAIAPDDRTIVAVFDDRIQMWDHSTQALIRTIADIEIRNPSKAWVAVDPRGKYVAVADGQSCVRVWNLATGEAHLGHDRRLHWYVTQTAYSPDGRLIATAGGGEVLLWNAANGELVRRLGRPRGGWIAGLAFSKDGSRLAVGASELERFAGRFTGSLRMFDVASGKLRFQCDLDEAVTNLSIAPDGNVIAIVAGHQIEGAKDPGITFFDAASGHKLRSVTTSTYNLAAVSWLPDSKVFMTVGRENMVRQYNVDAGVEFAKLDVPHERQDPRTGAARVAYVASGVFLRGSSVLTSASDPPEIHCWDLIGGRKSWTIMVEAQSVRKMAASADEHVLAAVCVIVPNLTHQLRLWEVATQRELMALQIPAEAVYSIAFSPDGGRVATGLEDGTVLIWDAPEAVAKLK